MLTLYNEEKGNVSKKKSGRSPYVCVCADCRRDMMDVLEKREEQVSLRKEGRKGEGKKVESMCCCSNGEFL